MKSLLFTLFIVITNGIAGGIDQTIAYESDHKSGEYFRLYYNGFDLDYETNIRGIEHDKLKRVIRIADSLDLDLPFLVQILFRESRMGANTLHDWNSDGTLDGGYFGINSRWHPIKLLGDPEEDVYIYGAYCHLYVYPYPRHEWLWRYVYGDVKARELKLIK
ncbi:MAG TPA: hypothetical protein PKU71_13580 [bacterium]|nr:hypothetical protein [bacterium]